MEEWGCNWKESLTNMEEILVLISPMNLNHLNHFDLHLPPGAGLEEKTFVLVTPGEWMVPCKEGVWLSPTEMLWPLSFGTAFTTSSHLLHKEITAVFVGTSMQVFLKNPVRLVESGWSRVKLNCDLTKFNQSGQKTHWIAQLKAFLGTRSRALVALKTSKSKRVAAIKHKYLQD